MPKDDRVYLGHMLDCTREVLALCKDSTAERFASDRVLQLAAIHLLQVIGEAARQLHPEILEQHPQVPWKSIVGMRNKLVHDYLAINLDLVWAVITKDLPDLEASLARMLGE
jgi:uncharacterized protein with HEPN domain